MLDTLTAPTAAARKSAELTEGDLGMGHGPVRTSPASTNSTSSSTSPNATTPSPNSPNSFFRLWLVLCLDLVRRAMRRLAALVPMQAASVEELRKAGSLEMSLSESGYGSTDDLDSARARVTTRVTTIPTPISLRPKVYVDVPDDSLSTILGAVAQTKIITTVFEVRGAGLGCLQPEFLEELSEWFRAEGLLVVASELVWSVPAARRTPRAEVAMKEALFAALRRNNKRVLDLRWPRRRLCSPVAMPESGTEEISGRDKGLAAYQGTFRRYYDALVPLQHRETGPAHADYWAFSRSDLRPAPHRFLYGPRRDISELTHTTLLALNCTAITFR